MISERECFVYIVPPGETGFVTAGKFRLSATRSGDAIGHFVYGKSWLGRADEHVGPLAQLSHFRTPRANSGPGFRRFWVSLQWRSMSSRGTLPSEPVAPRLEAQ